MSARMFRAQSLPAALAAVRLELGDDAVIVSVDERELTTEVVAVTSRQRKGMRQLFERVRAARQQEHAPALAVGAEHVAVASVAPAGADDADDADDLELPEPVADDHVPPAERAGILSRPGLRVVGSERTAPSPISRALDAMDLPPDLAARVASAAGRGPLGWERVLSWLERGWPIPEPPTSRPGCPQAVAFLGGAHVGRSTLIRGLASRAVLDEPGRVVIVQLGFPGRPVQPMDELSAPIGVEVRRANHPGELRQVVLDHQDVSAVLLDLPSVDVHDRGERAALARFVAATNRACPQVSWHAVLPATWSTREATRAVRALEFAQLRGIAWTFLDRVADPGTVIATTLRADVAPSFMHGEPRGNGEHSGSARWDGIVDWLSSESKTGP
jgi:flagellar biosynthesis GTPase FlhF